MMFLGSMPTDLKVLLCVVLALAGSGCGLGDRQPAEETVTFQFHLSEDPGTLDPALAYDFYSFAVIDRIFDGLMRLDRQLGAPVPDLAASYRVADDGLTYEFELLDEALFHDRQPVLASDVVFSFERFAQQTKHPFGWILDPLVGIEAFRRGDSDGISGLVVEAPRRLVMHLQQPTPQFLNQLALPMLSVVSQRQLEDESSNFARYPIGSGPFRFVERIAGQRVDLAAFKQHPRRVAEVDRLTFQVIEDFEEAVQHFAAGDLDLVSRLPSDSLDDLTRRYPAAIHNAPTFLWQGFCLRCDRPPFDDPKVRRALSLAIDRQALVQRLGGIGQAESGFVMQDLPGSRPQFVGSPFDLPQARRLLAEAGYGDGNELPLVLYGAPASSQRQAVKDFLQEALADVGLRIEGPSLDFPALQSGLEKGEFSMFHFSFGAVYPDPEALLYTTFHSSASQRLFGYANPEVDRLLEAARQETDTERRFATLQRVEEILTQEMPCVPLLHFLVQPILLQERWQGMPIGFPEPLFEVELARARAVD